MRRWAVAVMSAAVVVSGLIAPAPVVATSCVGRYPEDVAREADLIYVARVVGKRVVSVDEIRYRLEVLRRIKGRPGDYERTSTYDENGSGPLDLAIGHRLLVVDDLRVCSYTDYYHFRRLERRLNRITDRLAGRTPSRHVVQDGDWLWGLARQRLRFDGGTPTPRQIRRAADAIYERNRYRIGPDPDHLPVGTTLRIPVLH